MTSLAFVNSSWQKVIVAAIFTGIVEKATRREKEELPC